MLSLRELLHLPRTFLEKRQGSTSENLNATLTLYIYHSLERNKLTHIIIRPDKVRLIVMTFRKANGNEFEFATKH